MEINETVSFDKAPGKTIMDFLLWYRDHQSLQDKLVNGNGDDSNENYSVNFEETEKYLAALKASGFISDKYVNTRRAYFVDCEKQFKEHPENEGPPAGFDYDFVMSSQDYADDLANLDKARILSHEVKNDSAGITVALLYGKLSFLLSRENGQWKIDEIENVYEENRAGVKDN